MAGCSTLSGTRQDALEVELASPSTVTSTPAKTTPSNDEKPITIKHDDKSHIAASAKVEPGTGRLINEDAARAPLHNPPAAEGQITLNFESMPIQAAVQQILGGLLQENYTIAPSVTGNVTFSTAKPITAEQAMPILEMLLAWTNNTLIRKEGRYEVVPIKDAIPGNLTPRITPPRLAQGYEVRAFPLHYIAATEMQKLLKPYAKADAVVSADNARAMIVMAGTASELENYQRTIEVFDVDWLKGMSVGVYGLRNMDITKMMPELDKVFGAAGESPLAGMFRFVPMETTNSVVVITPQRSYLEQAEQWLYRLDMGVGENGTQLYVYDVKNAKATDLSDHLNAIFTGRSGGTSGSNYGNVAPGLRPVTIGALGGSGGGLGGVGGVGGMNSNNSRLGGGSNYGNQGQGRTGVGSTTATGGAAGANASTTGSGAAAGAAGKTETDIRITPIEENNQLLVMATPGEWDSILAAIRRLDIPQLQVQLEVKILEITLTGNLQFGLQWYLAGLIGTGTGSAQANGNYQPPFTGNLWDRHRAELGATGNVGPTNDGGFFYSFLNKNFEVAINALQQNGQARTLSAPSMVVMNNQEAQINVGTQIPVVQTYYNGLSTGVTPTTGTGTGNALGTSAYGGTTGSVQYLNTGVVLDVKPRVNPGGLVYLEVQQEVSNPEAAPAGTNPPIDQRQLSTQVAVQSGRTVLLGGLIRDLGTISDTGIPLLSSIPVIGHLFGNTTHTTTRTELIVLITPQVINNADDADRVTAEYQSRFKSLAPLHANSAEKVVAPPAPAPAPQNPPPPESPKSKEE
jgi:general secretion pathway protein D